MDPLSGLLMGLGGKLIDALFPGKEKAAEAKLKLFELQQNGQLAIMANDTALAKMQADINAVEAASPNLFVSGWRPFIGWICGIGLTYQFLVYPILIAFVPKIVQLDMGTLITLLFGLLGLGVLRTQEKIKGVA